MMLFARPKPPTLSRGDALAVKPLRTNSVCEETTPAGLRLLVKLHPTPVGRWFLRISRSATKTFELDTLGTFVWRCCDGRTPVSTIIRKLSAEHRLNLREAEVATTAFLATLVKKGLIGMPVKLKSRSRRK